MNLATWWLLVNAAVVMCDGQAFDRHRRDASGFIAEKKRSLEEQKQRHKQIVRQVNRTPNATWKAAFNPSGPLQLVTKPNFFATDMDEFKKSLFGYGDQRYMAYRSDRAFNQSAHIVQAATSYLARQSFTDRTPLPKQFDAREKWIKCSNLHLPTTNQGRCGGCYAVSTVSAISDRICISSGQKLNIRLSAIDAIGCNSFGLRCNGGMEFGILSHWVNEGIVTGGSYGSEEGCRPFQLDAKCGGPCPISELPDVECVKSCRTLYPKNYSDDKYYGKNFYNVVDPEDESSRASAEANMMHELYERGPIITSFPVAEDFIHYKSGVYQRITGENVYFHSVKLIGWGEEKGVPYWIGANSWGRDWGDHGFFKFLRGSNHLFFESDVYAGTPQIRK